MYKKDIRKVYKKKRMELAESAKMKLDDLLLIQLQRLPLHNGIQTLLSYWPLERHNEMNVLLYTNYLEHAIPGLKVTFPIVDFTRTEMKAVLVGDETDFVENNYGIPEPENGEEINPVEIDLVFVPLLAFDNEGYRVGYGKGFYDRFLSTCRRDIVKVGFSYFEPVERIVDRDQFDVPLNFCITPERIYEF